MPTAEKDRVYLTVNQIVPVNVRPARLSAQTAGQPFVLIYQNAADIMPGRVGRVEGLAGEDLDHSIFKLDLTSKRQVQDVLPPLAASKTTGFFVLCEGKKPLVLHNLVRILKVANEVNDR